MIHINEIKHEYNNHFKLCIENLHLPQNQIIGLVGENGSGKTTLMSILSGYLKANISYDISFNANTQNILFIPTDVELYDFLTTRELLTLVKKYSSCNMTETEMLATLELSDKANCPIDELSMGMKKKLTLLPLLIRQNDLIILDEPFNSIDMNYIYKLKQILMEQKAHSTILISSHILETLVDLCDSFVLLSNGYLDKTFVNNRELRMIEGELFERSN